MSKYGVLLAISSLPGNHGIGDFGKSAYEFVDFLSEKGYKYWQILPINPLGPGNSPYMSTCSEAIEPRYIDLNGLIEMGLLDNIGYYEPCSSVDYQRVKEFKEKILRTAFRNFQKIECKEYEKFKNENLWVYPYSVFTYFREKNNEVVWNNWPDSEKFYYDRNSIKKLPNGHENECEFYIFCQYIAWKQFKKLREYLKFKNIKLIADCPFYVGIDSTDCWLNKEEFVMNENYEPILVSGCPPDDFSKEGQLWGTPIYDFEKMSANNYKFLIHRIGYLATSCDYLRLDHFRAFDTYCVIPSEDKNALRGYWKNGPKNAFFDKLFECFPNINIIAEDLGILFQSVHDLRDFYRLPGMYITQFAIFDEWYRSNCNQIVYPGTHDNHTLRSWVDLLNDNDKQRLRIILKNDNLYKAVFDFTWNANSLMTIFPMQDLLFLDDSCRMNNPGTIGSPNWEWKLKENDYRNQIVFGF